MLVVAESEKRFYINKNRTMQTSTYILRQSWLGLMTILLAFTLPAFAQEGEKAKQEAMKKKMKAMTPAKGYIKAHKDVQKPFEILGGPIEINIAQNGGGVFVALPDKRELDATVFGTPENPRAMGGTPAMTGLPPMVRATKGGEFTETKMMTPFGDKHVVMPNGNLQISAMDVTATDAAVTDDKVQMEASWEDEAGNTYTVKCCEQLASHGLEYPTFGGVVTNIILHGFTNIGTPLMPSEYTYFAFWGMGSVSKNGEVLQQPRLIHGMLTEYVRTEGYELAMDEEVTPTRRHFHLMVAPFAPDMENMTYVKKPVKTGFTLPNGKELPFWHVMFENLDIDAERQ